MRDIDLLVRPEDLSRAERGLVHLGYEHITSKDGAVISCEYHWRFESPEFPHAVELHWGIRSPDAAVTIPLDELWERSTNLSQFDTRAHFLRREILFLYLSVHVHKHRWYDCLSHLYDIALLVDRDREKLCWSSIVQDARRWGWEEQLHLLWEHLEALFPGLLPEHLPVRPLHEAARQALVARVMGRAKIGAGLLYSRRWTWRDYLGTLRLDLLSANEKERRLSRRVHRFLVHLMNKFASHTRTSLGLILSRQRRSEAKAWADLEQRTNHVPDRKP